MSTKKHGGVRPGSGRKQVTDKKISLWIYELQSVITAAGGIDGAKTIAVQAINRAAKRNTGKVSV